MSLKGLSRSGKILCISCLLLCNSNAFANNASSTAVNTVLRTPTFISNVNNFAHLKTNSYLYNIPAKLRKQTFGIFYTGGVPTGFAGEIDTTPTIDKINSAATDYTTPYTLTPLTGTLPDGAVQVTINGTKYYYTPDEGADINTLQNLANIGNAALVETPDGNNSQLTYIVNGKYYTYDTNKLPVSGYTLTKVGAKGDTTITLYETAANGVLTPVYYNVKLKKTEYGSGDTTLTFGWKKNAKDRFEFKQNPANPVEQKITYNYNSTEPKNTRRTNTTDSSGTTIGGLFQNINTQPASGTAYGGAIYNNGASAKLGNINADFVNNYASSTSSTAAGGGIFNYKGTIGNIEGDFIGNYAKSTNGAVWGGAILNWDNSSIGDIDGNFIGNYISSTNNAAKGGVIHNDNGKTGNITGDFIGNFASGGSYALGGAVYNLNKSVIKDITGDFIGNYAVSSSAVADNHNVAGGGIYNDDNSTIGNITGDFIGNYVTSGRDVWGGAILNWHNSTIGNITGDFIGNYIVSSKQAAKGGAIHNDIGKIGDVTGNFIDNYAFGYAETYGGAIYNKQGSTIGKLTGDFIGNYAKSTNGEAFGGAIYNTEKGSIQDITGNFVENYVSGNTAYGGAIYNTQNASINNITKDFKNNYASASSSTAAGGAIYNTQNGTIQDISGNFVENHVSGNTAYGGAIYNTQNASINNITKDFKNNYASASSSTAAGGAIYNAENGTIQDISGNFVGNHANSTDGIVWGGAILNLQTSRIGDINGNFSGNYIVSSKNAARGGAVHNDGIMENIIGKFSDNYATGVSSAGGALCNHGSAVIKDIKGDFTGNYAKSTNGEAFGGAIYNTEKGSIQDITGNFVENYVSGNTAYGGAIYNTQNASINNITKDFKNNYASASSSTAAGGAIYNAENGTIQDISGNFEENHADSTNGEIWGGAILNWNGTIDNINGNFKDNYLVSFKNAAKGGAIHNDAAEIGDIIGSFEGNYASGASTYGGAIYNKDNGNIGDIEGNFINNHGTSSKGEALGGAIYNTNKSNIGNITGNFEDNYAFSATSTAQGGAIYDNNGKIGELDAGKPVGGIYGSFINNYAKTDSQNQLALGGAVYTKSDMNFIADNKNIEFTGNYTQDSRGKINNAIFVETGSSSSPTMTLKAQNNGSITFNDQIDGGSVSGTTINRSNAYKLSLTGDETGLITLNDQIINANAIHDNVILKIGNANTFKESTLTTNSGIIDTKDGNYTNYNIKELKSSENTRYNIDISLSKDEQKSDTFTIANDSSGVIYLSSINITNNCDYNDKFILQIIKSKTDIAPELKYDDSKVLQWATPNMTSDTIIAQEFGLDTTKTHNDSIAIRGILDAFLEWAELQTDESKSFTFVDSSEYIASRDITALNGTNLTINGSGNTLNLNNKNIFSDIKDTQEVTMNNMTVNNAEISNNGTINLDTITLDKSVNVNNNNTINVIGNSSFGGKVKNNSVININNANTDFNSEVNGANGSINLENSVVNINDKFKNQSINQIDGITNINNVQGFVNNSLTLSSGDFNIANLGLNNLHFDKLNLAGGNININNVQVDLANNRMGRISADSYGNSLQGTINVNDMIVTSDSKGSVTPILFADSAIKNNIKTTVQEIPTDSQEHYVFSPIFRYSVKYNNDGTYGDGGYFVFNRDSMNTKNTAKYNPAVLASPVSTQIGGYLTQLQTLQDGFYHMDRYTKYSSAMRLAAENNNKYAITETPGYSKSPLAETSQAMWVKPYTSFESIDLKGGVDVSTVTYGTLYGGDTDLVDLGHGFKGVISTFIGYNGSHQSYNGISMNQNGGTLGVTGTLYKGNFFTGLTASTGASAGEAYTNYGQDNFAMLTAGIANKTGYNWEISEGKFIVQPSVFLGYTFVNTFDYTNCAGVRMDSDPLHAITIVPGVKLIGNLNNGWQPYLGVDMVWNIIDKTNVMANDVRLPQLSVKPYVQYGVGVQKNWGERFTAFFQTMIRNGGRSGIVLTGGFRWAIGIDQASSKPKQKKVIKENI